MIEKNGNVDFSINSKETDDSLSNSYSSDAQARLDSEYYDSEKYK